MTTPTPATEPQSVPDAQPLSEPNPKSLDALFSEDPSKLSDDDFMVVVATLRAQRERWVVEEAAGARKASQPKAPKEPKKTLSLDDLME